MDIKLESEWLPDGEDQWGHRVNAEVYRVDNVDPVIAELQSEVDSWKAAAETFEDFYRKTEVQCDGLEVEVTRYLEQIEQMQSELTKARELVARLWTIAPSVDDEFNDLVSACLAHQSSPAAKDLTKHSHNQCDGCQAGIPLEVNQYGTPLHRMGCEGGYPDYMACTAKLYAED